MHGRFKYPAERRFRGAGRLLAGCAALAAPSVVHANTTYYFVGTNPLWNTAANWSPATVPTGSSADAYLGTTNNTNSVILNVTYTSANALDSLTLNSTVASTIALYQNTSSSAMVAGNEYIGTTISPNYYNQSAGTNTVTGNLELGGGTGASGNYYLSGSGLLTAANESIGNNTTGFGGFLQTGGINNISGGLTVGTYGGTNSNTYILTGGTVNFVSGSNLQINGALSSFNQTAGSVTFTSTFQGINVEGLSSSYTLSGTGAINASQPDFSETIGASQPSTDTFTQTGGTQFLSPVATNGTLNVTAVPGGSASYTLSATTGIGSLTVDNENIGGFSSAFSAFTSGTFNQSGGTNTTNSELLIGYAPSYLSSYAVYSLYNLAGGSLNANGSGAYIGIGAINQSNGTATLNGLDILGSPYLPGYYTLTGGNLNVSGTVNISGLIGAGFNQSAGIAYGQSLTVGLNGTGNFNLSGSAAFNCAGVVYVGYGSNGGTSVGNFNISGNATFNCSAAATIGYAPQGAMVQGTYLQSGGTAIFAGGITIGQTIGIVGGGGVSALATVTGGSLNLGSGTLFIGSYSGSLAPCSAAFNQTGGTVTIGALEMASGSGGTSTYTLSGPTATSILNDSAYEFIGASGAATFNQTGGTHTIASGAELVLGQFNTGSGTYLLSGGVLNSNSDMSIGSSGTGTFNQTGGSLSCVGGILVGDYSGSAGTYDLTNGNASTVTLFVGYSGNGTFNHFSGNMNVSGSAYIGANSGSVGVYNIYNGTLNVSGGLYVGYQGAVATVNQTGGLVSVLSGQLNEGYFSGASGIYNLKGGTLTTVQDNIGFLGNGVFNQSGGAFSASGFLAIGTYSSSVSQYNFTAGNASIGSLDVGESGSGTLNQSGSSSNLSAGEIDLGYSPGATGVFNLSAGNVSTGKIYVGESGTGSLNINGGNMTAQYVSVGILSGTGAVNLSFGTLSATTSLNINPNGSFTLSGSGTLNLNTSSSTVGVVASGGVFTQTGGTINGPLLNGGFFNYSGGAFNGQFTNSVAGVANFSTNSLSVTGGILNHGVLNISSSLGTPVGQTFFNDGTINITTTGSVLSNGPVVNDGTINLSNEILEYGGFTNNLLLDQGAGNASIVGPGTVANYGTFNLSSGHSFSIGIPINNYGQLNVNGALIETSAADTLINQAGGFVNGPGTILTPFTNSGTVLPGNGSLYIQSGWSNSGSVQLTASTSGLTGGTITNTGTISGFGTVGSPITNTGTLQGQGGTLLLEGTVTNPTGGMIAAGTGGEVLVTSGLATNAGIISLTGGTFDNGGATLLNTGQITGYGTLRTGGLANAGHFTLSGTSGGATTTVTGNVTNNTGQLITIEYQPAIFTGNIVNNGTFVTVGTTVTFAGSYSGNAYISDPSTNIFQSNVTITSGGSMTGAVGDSYSFFGGLVTNNGSFNNSGSLVSSDNFVNTSSFIQTGSQKWLAGTSFNNTTGTATFGSDAGAGGQNLTVNVLGGSTAFTTTQHLLALNISTGAIATLTGGGNGHRSMLYISSLSVQGTLDLTANDLDLQNGGSAGLSSVTGLVKLAYSNGTWTGAGITSSTAAGNSSHLTAVGVILNPTSSSLDGLAVAGNDVLAKYTYYGDANLDGQVNSTDYTRIDSGYLTHATGWANGDFNYDGVINGSDYTLIDNAFNSQGAQLTAQIATQISDITAVPEPAGLAIIGGVCLSQLAQRRNRIRERRKVSLN